ncbi:hypothetical protein D3C75_1171940 [compost metagenome]
MCRTETFLAVTSVNPCTCQASCIAWYVVVVQAFSGMQDIFLLDTSFGQQVDHVREVIRIRFVGTDILCSHNVIELNT